MQEGEGLWAEQDAAQATTMPAMVVASVATTDTAAATTTATAVTLSDNGRVATQLKPSLPHEQSEPTATWRQQTALQAQEGALCSYCASKLSTWTTPAPPRPMTFQAPRHQMAWRPTAASGRRHQQAIQAANGAASDAVVVRCCLTCGSVSVSRCSSRSSSRERKPG